MKKTLLILLSIFLLTSCSNSENPIHKQELTMYKDEIPQETIDGITEIVLNYERTGVETSCENCRCAIKKRHTEVNGNVTYQFTCSSGINYWAVYCSDSGGVVVAPIIDSGQNQTGPPPPPC